MSISKIKLTCFFILTCLLANYKIAHPIAFFKKGSDIKKFGICAQHKRLLFVGVASFVLLLVFLYFRNALLAGEDGPEKLGGDLPEKSHSKKPSKRLIGRHVTFNSIEYDLEDNNSWEQLKIAWPKNAGEEIKDKIIEQEREEILLLINDTKRCELQHEEKKFKVSNLRNKIKNKEHISREFLVEVRDIVRKNPRALNDILEKLSELERRTLQIFFENSIEDILTNVGNIINVGKKLYSKEKNISSQEWEDAKKSSFVLPYYDNKITRILRKDLNLIKRKARAIDGCWEEFINSNGKKRLKLKITCSGLPEYIPHINQWWYKAQN